MLFTEMGRAGKEQEHVCVGLGNTDQASYSDTPSLKAILTPAIADQSEGQGEVSSVDETLGVIGIQRQFEAMGLNESTKVMRCLSTGANQNNDEARAHQVGEKPGELLAVLCIHTLTYQVRYDLGFKKVQKWLKNFKQMLISTGFLIQNVPKL